MPMKQIPLAITLDTEQSFANFVIGSNALTFQHVRDLTAGRAPIYLWGPTGCGKTHLLHALVQQQQRRGARVGWFGAADALPWTHDPAWSLIVLDDCDRFDADQQQAAFALFVEASSHGTVIAAAGRLPPVDLALRDDLRTRLGWGVVLALQPLSETDSRAALRREADRRGLFLSDEVMDYLLNRFARDLKHLMACLDRLDDFARVSKRAISVPLLRQMLTEKGVE